MFKYTCTYTDYNGFDRTEDFYFHFSEAELAEMQLSVNGGMGEMLENIVKANDIPTIVKLFKDLVLKAYGVKSSDGRRFEKSDEISREFSQTPAYSQLYIRLATDEDFAIKFINEVIPKEIKDAGKNNVSGQLAIS